MRPTRSNSGLFSILIHRENRLSSPKTTAFPSSEEGRNYKLPGGRDSHQNKYFNANCMILALSDEVICPKRLFLKFI